MSTSPDASTPAFVATCACPRATHKHGDRNMYGYHRCRCAPCCTANRDYYQSTAHITRRLKWADAAQARKRILRLREAGLTMDAMADMCSVDVSTLHYLLRGPGGRKVKRVLASTLDALNAISSRDITARALTEHTRVDGELSRRQIQSLHTVGWSVQEMAIRGSVSLKILNRILRGCRVSVTTRRHVDALYRELLRVEPPAGTGLEVDRRNRALTRAAANGWLPEMVDNWEYAKAA